MRTITTLSIIQALLFLLIGMLSLPARAMTHVEEADSLMNLGLHYRSESQYMDALEALTLAVEKAESSHNDAAYLQSLLAIADIHSLFEDQELATHYYDLCYEKAEELGYQMLMNHAAYNKLISLCTLGDYEQAKAWHDKIGIIEMDEPHKTRFFGFNQQGHLAKAKQDYHAASYYFNEALQYAQNHEMGIYYEVPTMGQIGTMEERMGHDSIAIDWYLRCMEGARQQGFMAPLVTSYERLSSIHRKLHNDSISMYYQRLYVQLTDSLFNEHEFNNKRSRIVNYESRVNLLKIDTLNSRNHLLLWIVVIFAVMLVLLIGLVSYIVKQNRHLTETQRLLIGKHKDLSRQLDIQRRMSEEYFNKVGETEADEYISTITEEADIAEEPSTDAEDTQSEESIEADTTTPLLDRAQTDHLLMAIGQVMDDIDQISDPEFSLQRLATLVKSNTKYVSWAINATYGKNFKTYLNEYRVREASRRLIDHEKYGHLTIAAISVQLGYKSPTSFNQAFKRVFGMTPAAYLKVMSK